MYRYTDAYVVCTYMHTHIYVCIYMSCMYICMYVYTHMLYAYTYTQIHIFSYLAGIHMYIYIYTHIYHLDTYIHTEREKLTQQTPRITDGSVYYVFSLTAVGKIMPHQSILLNYLITHG